MCSFRARLVADWLISAKEARDITSEVISYEDLHSLVGRMFAAISSQVLEIDIKYLPFVKSHRGNPLLDEVIHQGEIRFQLELATSISTDVAKHARRLYLTLWAHSRHQYQDVA